MANTYLTWTPSTTPTGSAKTWTYSVWVKMAQENPGYFFAAGSGTQSKFIFGAYGGGDIDILTYEGYVINANTARLFRDTNAWYHVVLACDTTQAVPANGIKLYINGVQETLTFNSQGSENGYTQNTSLRIGTSGEAINIGRDINDSGHWKGCMSHINFVDGQQLTPSAFGSTDSTTGEWEINIDPSVTYGNNGFWILKDGNSVTDQSGEGNNWTVGGGTLTKTEDSPSNVFATWNSLQATTSSTYDFVSGNTRVAANDVAQFSLGATLAAKTGKYYMEMIWAEHGGYDRWGIMPINASVSSTPHITGIAWDESAANLYMLGNVVSGSWGSNMSGSDIIQIALDLDNGAFYLGVNGTWRNSGDPTSGASRTGAANFSATSLFGEDLTFAVGKGNAGTSSWNANFGNGYFDTTAVASAGTNVSGNGIFEYDVPTGYTALSTKGLNL